MKEYYQIYRKKLGKATKTCIECGKKMPAYKVKYCSGLCTRQKYAKKTS